MPGSPRKKRPKVPNPTFFERWAIAQGVERPFGVLEKMEPGERKCIAELLGVTLDNAWTEGIEQAKWNLDAKEGPPKRSQASLLPQAEAVCIIGMAGKGIQARSHSMWRTLSPIAKNHTWQEVLEGVIKELKIKCDSKSVVDMEAAIFEYAAGEALKKMSKEDLDGIDDLGERNPGLVKQLAKAGFGSSGRRLILAGIAKATLGQGFKAYIGAVKLAALANRKIGTKLVMSSVTTGLKTTLRGLNVLLWGWLALDILNLFFGSSRKRLLPVIVQIRAVDLLQKME